MPLTHGSVTFREFIVEGELLPNWPRAFDAELRRYAFRPIAVEKGEMRSAGWVNPSQVLDVEVPMEKLRLGPWVLLALRQDRLGLNARLFRARRDVALKEAADKARKTRLSKEERKMVEEKVRLDMLRHQTPATAIIEAAWRPDDALIFVAASSEAAALAFSEVFTVTFGLALVPSVAAMRTIRWAGKNGLDNRLAELAPTAFARKAVLSEKKS